MRRLRHPWVRRPSSDPRRARCCRLRRRPQDSMRRGSCVRRTSPNPQLRRSLPNRLHFAPLRPRSRRAFPRRSRGESRPSCMPELRRRRTELPASKAPAPPSVVAPRHEHTGSTGSRPPAPRVLCRPHDAPRHAATPYNPSVIPISPIRDSVIAFRSFLIAIPLPRSPSRFCPATAVPRCPTAAHRTHCGAISVQ